MQKGFGLPAGFGVLIVSPLAIEKSKYLFKKNINIGSYHNFLSLFEKSKQYQTPETPNILNMFLLERVIEDMLRIGIDKIRKETDLKANLIYQFLEKSKFLSSFVEKKANQSKTVIVAQSLISNIKLIKYLKNEGLVVAKGYGNLKEKTIRIANFPAHSILKVKKLLNVLKKYSFHNFR